MDMCNVKGELQVLFENKIFFLWEHKPYLADLWYESHGLKVTLLKVSERLGKRQFKIMFV